MWKWNVNLMNTCKTTVIPAQAGIQALFGQGANKFHVSGPPPSRERRLSHRSLITVLLSLVFITPVFGEAPAMEGSSLTADIAVGTGVENHEATGVSDSFSSDTEQLVGWSRVKGAAEPAEIRHVWSYNGKELDSIALNVQSSSYRTFSRKTVKGMPGTWTLEVKDNEGRLIGSKKVEVTAAGAQ
jgi:hypothetical protein